MKPRDQIEPNTYNIISDMWGLSPAAKSFISLGKELLESDNNGGDFTITSTDGKEFKAHSWILAR